MILFLRILNSYVYIIVIVALGTLLMKYVLTVIHSFIHY